MVFLDKHETDVNANRVFPFSNDAPTEYGEVLHEDVMDNIEHMNQETLPVYNQDNEQTASEEQNANAFSAPPLPVTPPPPKAASLKAEDSILSMFDPLENATADDSLVHSNLESNVQSPISPTTEFIPDGRPVLNKSLSYLSDEDQVALPSIPDSYMPRWSRQTSEPSVDLDLLQFELMTDEQEHLPASILPDTPQPASLATTITDDDASLTETEHDYDHVLNEQLAMLEGNVEGHKKSTVSGSPSVSASTSKRNSWNTTSSFAYENEMGSLENDDLDHNWSENTPSIIKVPSSETVDTGASKNVKRTSHGRKKNSNVMNIAAMFEANSPNSSKTSSLERQKDNVGESSKAQKPPLVRRPTAMEILATPTTPPKYEDPEDDIDLRKLRRSIVRGARSAGGLKTDPDALLQDPKLKRSVSLSPIEVEKKKNLAERPKRERPRSLIMQKDVEASF